MKILIVDDESAGRSSLCALLTACDHEVETAAHGEEAIEIASDFCPDAAIIDLYLGTPMNGTHVAARLRDLYGGLRILVISGHLTIDEEEFANLDARYLAKPFQLDELLQMLGP